MTLSHKLTPVPFTNVRLTDRFWAPRIEINRAVTLPAEYTMLESTGRLAALDLKWKKGRPNPPHIFWDSDIAKWIEAASYSLATDPDAALDKLLDRVIAKLAKAQQPDGYLNSHYIVFEREGLDRRWTNLRDNHELYCAGHLIEAAVAHYQATGKQSLLDVMCRYADYIDRVFGRGRGKLRGYCGHEEIELALVKLYRVTGNPRYVKLAQYFVDERGRQPHYFDIEARRRGENPRAFWAGTYEYNQSHLPVREQTVVTGHAVRAMYLYSAMADLATETGDESLLAACERIWHSVVDERMYITGGIGPSARNEGFTVAYDLPDETAYAETCAAIGMVFWNHRLLQFNGDGKYADVMERALYNGTISGVSLDGTKFFYENPLASRGAHHRQGWFDCACCPPNIARLIASVSGYFYSTSEDGVWIHLYAESEANIMLHGRSIALRQATTYPWDGAVQVALRLDQPTEFTLRLRIPGWCERYTVRVNGKRVQGTPERGYVCLTRVWQNGDTVDLTLDMPVRLMAAHPQVRQMVGRVAIQRGPVVYCLEGVDHAISPLDRILIPLNTRWEIEHHAELLGGVVVLRATAKALQAQATEALYAPAAPPRYAPVQITAVPYHAWDNRAPGEMRVWFRAV
ncbi:MAG: glycoside hydrolase family 127 protein [Anaerolineae bacterium]|nr:glycoside hydrolase family 127 protein [Thermoflexales bacterium]MDW8406888.1 glycoside hydrolase family 127 protein [Anaerolineae bacterium]